MFHQLRLNNYVGVLSLYFFFAITGQGQDIQSIPTLTEVIFLSKFLHPSSHFSGYTSPKLTTSELQVQLTPDSIVRLKYDHQTQSYNLYRYDVLHYTSDGRIAYVYSKPDTGYPRSIHFYYSAGKYPDSLIAYLEPWRTPHPMKYHFITDHNNNLTVIKRYAQRPDGVWLEVEKDSIFIEYNFSQKPSKVYNHKGHLVFTNIQYHPVTGLPTSDRQLSGAEKYGEMEDMTWEYGYIDRYTLDQKIKYICSQLYDHYFRFTSSYYSDMNTGFGPTTYTFYIKDNFLTPFERVIPYYQNGKLFQTEYEFFNGNWLKISRGTFVYEGDRISKIISENFNNLDKKYTYTGDLFFYYDELGYIRGRVYISKDSLYKYGTEWIRTIVNDKILEEYDLSYEQSVIPRRYNKILYFYRGTLGQIEEKIVEKISIFPNPAKDYFEIKFPQQSFAQIAIFDLTGREVLSASTDNIQEKISTEFLASGMYIIRINFLNQSITKKLHIHR
ncbi:hypothetical protein JCM31826_21250 [Thermaurantimonas aggregans]|uniref:Secretion system C-terminal sorting domain-containing protein n=1 Tax=Thermaurantimonas aggregans TaxID=2173829 RepID=A0A401XNV6_9FLAO|nr:T9SS type A sorting domain-containing protein [Thermaurantimonas aggregans]GCD78643.1 hypothetical protein JCM31826_21250 [Thermaurantimonas aggregans]